MTQNAWITGAGKGIGRAVAMLLAERGWQVAVTARTEDDLLSLCDESRNLPGRVYSYPGDITKSDNIEATVNKIEREIGPIDLAILNAGTYIPFGVENFSVAAFSNQIEINLIGTVNCLAPIMTKMKSRQQGHIAIVSSLSGYRGLPLASAYGASKAALTNMCEALKVELEPLGIVMSVVQPGFVRTPLTDQNRFSMPFLMEPQKAAICILKGIEQKKFEIVLPKCFAYILKILRCLPYFLYFKVTRRLLEK
jgi:short-subunit dehydrogenase